jgi:hypothetical protein
MKAVPLAERFWAKVNKTATCWLWTGHLNNRGYGDIWVNEHGKKELAHRTSWFLATGEWPIQYILHICDTPSCVRHEHHFQGTQADNQADMCKKGRASKGEGGADYNRTKTHCPKGHPYSGDNLILYKYGKYTFRRCRECQ